VCYYKAQKYDCDHLQITLLSSTLHSLVDYPDPMLRHKNLNDDLYQVLNMLHGIKSNLSKDLSKMHSPRPTAERRRSMHA
jgi:hypothetical protein